MPDILIGNVRGPQGEPGPANELLGQSYQFCESDSGTEVPDGPWLDNPPEDINQGMYYWCRNTLTWESGPETEIYAVGYAGRDGEFNGIELVQALETKVKDLENRTTPISKGGTESTTLEGAQAKLGITKLRTDMEAADKTLQVNIDAINDYTTGINLLRGTRNFTREVSTLGYGDHDDKYIAASTVTFNTGEDGFTVARMQAANANLFSSRISDYKLGDVFTVSFDVKFDSVNSLSNPTVVFIVRRRTSGGSISALQTFSVQNMKEQIPGIKAGEWTRCHFVATINAYAPGDTIYLQQGNNVELINAGMETRCWKLERESVNHSLWSDSPFDIDRINDVTTGINLLRGTRDFDEGIKEKLGDYYADGFGSLTNRNILKKVESNGFTSLTYINNGEYASFAIGAVQAVRGEIKAGDVLTVSFLFRRNAVFSYTNEAFVQISINGLSGSVQNFGTTYNNRYPVTNLEVGKWYPCVGEYVVPDGFVEGESFLRFDFRLNQTASNYSIMQPMIQPGSIDNPEWNYNPFDIATTAKFPTPDAFLRLENGTRLSSGDLDTILDRGNYWINSVSDANQISNTPVKSGMAIKVFDVVATKAQLAFVTNGTIYYRHKPGSSNWGDWKMVTLA